MSSVYMFNCLRKINCIRDLLYLALALTYIIGTAFGVAFTKYVKCLPLLLLLTQMHAYRRMHILVAMSEIAITFGAIGDVLLEIDGTIFFLIGAASFFIGHLFFISGFIATIMRLAAEKRL